MLQSIKEVFTEKYKDETEYLELKNRMKPYVKLSNKSEEIDSKIERLRARGYSSKCSIKVGEFR